MLDMILFSAWAAWFKEGQSRLTLFPPPRGASAIVDGYSEVGCEE